MEVTYHERAQAELAGALAFYRERSRGLGRAFAEEFRAAVELARTHPESGLSVRSGIRRLVLRRFPYSVLYGVTDQALRVVAVMHHRRDPGYWTERL